MEFAIAAQTDKGLVKDTNQDSLTVKRINTLQGKMVFAAVCDGMGGLAMGEVASATFIRALERWVSIDLPKLCEKPLEDAEIVRQWTQIVEEENNKIKEYGNSQGFRLGTTAVVMLLTQNRYYLMNVGDSRAYKIDTRVQTLTKDQTFVAREVEMGRMTPEQAEVDSRRSVLLQCIGASDEVHPDFFFDDVKANEVYMLCSDGFRHLISEEEIYNAYNPGVLINTNVMNGNARALINLNMSRQERDNISTLLVRTI